MPARFGAFDFRRTGDGGMEPMGVLLEDADGLGLGFRSLDEVADGDDLTVSGRRRYLSRFGGPLGVWNMSRFWNNAGAVLDAHSRFGTEDGFFPAGDVFLSPREWLCRRGSVALWGGSWMSFFVVRSAEVSADFVFEQFVVGPETFRFLPDWRLEMPSYARLGERPEAEGFSDQGLATLDMMRRGVAGYQWSDDPFSSFEVLRTLEVPSFG